MKISGRVFSIFVIVLLLSVAAFVGYKYLPKTGYAANQPDQNNVFTGRITNVKVSPGTIEGTSVYDRNCLGSHTLTECDAGIETEEYGGLNFHYQHNMMIQPCIHER